jgi:hypothetical protein
MKVFARRRLWESRGGVVQRRSATRTNIRVAVNLTGAGGAVDAESHSGAHSSRVKAQEAEQSKSVKLHERILQIDRFQQP